MNGFALGFLLWRTHLVRSFAPRRIWLLAALVLVPALIAAILSLSARRITSPEAVTNLAWFLQLQLVVPLVGLLAGIGVLAREVEDRTLTYLFTRPISRVAVFLGRTAGAFSVALVLNLLGSLALLVAAGGIRLGKTPDPTVFPLAVFPHDGVSIPILGAAVLGSLVYTALFACVSVFTRHPMIVGLVYTFAIESFLSNLPGANQSLTLQYWLRSWIADDGHPIWRRIEGFAGATYADGPEAALRVLMIAVLLLGIGAWRIRRKEFVFTS